MTKENLTYWVPFIDDSGAIQGYECPVQRDGFRVTGVWTEKDGYGAYIDNDNDSPFSVTQLRDLQQTVYFMLLKDDEMHSDTGPVGGAVDLALLDMLTSQQPAVSRAEDL